MAFRCPRCKGTTVRHDRSLAGRAVCGGCGWVIEPNCLRQAGQLLSPGMNLGTKLGRNKVSFAWLIPLGLLGGFLSIAINSASISNFLFRYSITARTSWNIATPADVELLIGKARQRGLSAASEAEEQAMRAIVSTLHAKNIRVLISDDVLPNAGGVWDPGRGEIRIRPSTVVLGTDALAQVLAHEAAHVAQSCRAGGIGMNSQPMGIQVDPVKTYQQQLDSALYKGSLADKAVELEAYAVGAVPEWAPKLLNYFCR